MESQHRERGREGEREREMCSGRMEEEKRESERVRILFVLFAGRVKERASKRWNCESGRIDSFKRCG